MEKIQFKDLPNMTTPLSSANLNQMQDNMEDAIIPIKLVTISDTAPGTATTGDMYYNTTDNRVYTATAENTWDGGKTPRYDGFYINIETNLMYYYNGTSLIKSGGDIAPIVKNEKTTSETDVYSCNYVNNIKQNTDRIILWENPNPDIAFSTQTVSLASSDYNYYEVIWGIDTNAQHLLSSGKIPAGFGTQLFRISANSGDPLRVRTVNAGATLGELVFNNAYSGASATTTIDNSQTIPKVIYGYYN